MTVEAAMELIRAKGYECIGLVIVHQAKASGGFVWLRPEYPDRAQLLQKELDFLTDGIEAEGDHIVVLRPS